MAEVYTGSRRYAVRFSVVANADHGLRQYAQLLAALDAALAENDKLGRVADAGDQVGASLDEAKRQLALTENADRTLAAKSHEFIEPGATSCTEKTH
jgi:hypothetical protein